jgi:hypothetical protein
MKALVIFKNNKFLKRINKGVEISVLISTPFSVKLVLLFV